MPGQRKRYSADLKAKSALEPINGLKTANEIAAEYGVHPSQIAQWKKHDRLVAHPGLSGQINEFSRTVQFYLIFGQKLS